MNILMVDGLCKQYPTFRLQDVSFSMQPGTIMGFIGRNGAGKTTTLKSILRLVHPDSGKIEIFGVDATKSDPHEVRNSLAVVPQRVMLFTGTILENLLWGKEDATREEVEAAALLVHREFLKTLYAASGNRVLEAYALALEKSWHGFIGEAGDIKARMPETLVDADKEILKALRICDARGLAEVLGRALREEMLPLIEH